MLLFEQWMICTKFLANGQRNSWGSAIFPIPMSSIWAFTLNHAPCKLWTYPEKVEGLSAF
jgi:hypothetical protein